MITKEKGNNMIDALKLDSGVQVETEKDSLGTPRGFETDVYPMTLKCVYIDTTASGAVMANAILEHEDGRKHTETECIMSKKSGELKSTYIDKNSGKPVPLPGYAKFLTLFRTIGNPNLLDLGSISAEKKILKLWDFTARAETNQEKTVFTDFLNVKLQVALQKTIEDKKKNVASEGEKADYRPTGETYESNKVQKWFNEDGKSLQEIKDGSEPKFKDEWIEAYQGKVRDNSTVKSGESGSTGAPVTSAPKATLDL